MLIGMNSTLHSTKLLNLKKFGQLATQKIQITCFAFFAPQSAPSGPSVPIFELVRAFDHRNPYTKFHEDRKKTVDAILPTDRRTDRQTDGQTDGRTDGRWRAYRRIVIS